MELNQQALLEKYTTKQTKLNKRQELLKMFQDHLNQQRGNYKPLEGKDIGVLMSYIKTQDLEDFYKKCEQAKNFSSCWWSHVKPKP